MEIKLEDLMYKRYVIIEHCNGEITNIKELELTEDELKKYWWDEYIIIEGKILKQ